MSGSVLKQPKAFYLIFFLEFWERFGFYGMQSLLVLFFVKHLGFSDAAADNLFGAFVALGFLLPPLGGYMGDHWLGAKRTVFLGTLLLIIGYASLSIFAATSIYIPLGIIAVGSGLFKANPANLMTKIYARQKGGLDSAFTLYYMAINLGSFVSIASTPYVSAAYGWSAAFAVCACGLTVALIAFFVFRNLLKAFGAAPDFKAVSFKTIVLVFGLVIVLIAICAWCLYHFTISGWVILTAGLVVVLFFLFQIMRASSVERKPLFVCLILIIQSIIFNVLYYQVPTSLSLFALRNVDPVFLGFHVEAASYRVFNSFWIVVLSPILAIIYNQLATHGKNPGMPSKFAFGTFVTGVAFLSLAFAAKYAAHAGIVSGGWIALFYFLEASGELLISALGLSMVSRYVPKRMLGFTMGVWFFSSSIAGILAGKVAGLASVPRDIVDPIASLPIYHHLFVNLGCIAVGISLVMALFVPTLNRMGEVKS
jgi:POT family proton-dependent oligopeptide transporter